MLEFEDGHKMYARLVEGTQEEIDSLLALAEAAGPGMTSIPSNRKILEQKIINSVKSSKGAIPKENSSFVFVLCVGNHFEEKIVGVSTIVSNVGYTHPYQSFKILDNPKIMLPIKDLSKSTLIGGLYVSEKYRKHGAAMLIAKIRYMYMAKFPELFCPTVISEIRGWQFNEKNQFFCQIMEHFFKMSFDESNKKLSSEGRAWIDKVIPKYPIYIDLLSGKAKDSIGAIHYNSYAAHYMLEKEGFSFDKDIDVIDGGPILTCKLENIKTIQNIVKNKKSIKDNNLYIVSTTDRRFFKAVYEPNIKFLEKRNYCGLDEEVQRILGVKKGDELLFSNLKDKET